mgnify:CR=1 FL=1
MKKALYIACLAVFVTGASAPNSNNFAGNWTTIYNGKTIPGALSQSGTRIYGHCIYPGGKRAAFQGTANGNTLSGTLYVDQKTRWTVNATLSGNAMSGTWSSGSGRGTPWTSTRR